VSVSYALTNIHFGRLIKCSTYSFEIKFQIGKMLDLRVKLRMLGGMNWLMRFESDLILLSMKRQGDEKTFVRLFLSAYVCMTIARRSVATPRIKF
jgi:hypothetical protein